MELAVESKTAFGAGERAVKSKSSKSALALLKVVESYSAEDVMEFTEHKKKEDRIRDRAFHRSKESKEHRPSSSVIVIDSKMTPLEAATLLWENNV